MTAPADKAASEGQDLLLQWRDKYYWDPVAFVREQIGMEPREWQVEFLNALADGERNVSVRSGHRVGKSTAVGWAMLWYLLTRFRVKIAVTAPSKQQMFDALWAEFQSSANRLFEHTPILADLIEIQTSTAFLVEAKADAFITAATARAESPEALAGKHSDFVMLIADEASGIPEPVFESALGSMAADNAVMILLGNPLRTTGFFHDTHTRAANRWFTMHVNAEDYASAEWVETMRLMYGENSNAYRVRVLGEFPTADDRTVVPIEYVWSAKGRDIKPMPEDALVWGLDVARQGTDLSALTRRRGRVLDGVPELFAGLETMQLVGQVKARYDAAAKKPTTIFVDAIGLGAGVADRLRELGLPARAVNVSEAPALDPQLYLNLKAELWYKARAWFEARDVSIPVPQVEDWRRDTVQRLMDELIAVQYDYTDKGKIKIESKKELRKRIRRSCDVADSFVLTFAGSAHGALHGTAGSTSWDRPLRRNLSGIV